MGCSQSRGVKTIKDILAKEGKREEAYYQDEETIKNLLKVFTKTETHYRNDKINLIFK